MSITDKYKYLLEPFGDILPEIKDVIQKVKLSQRFNEISVTENDKLLFIKAKEICELQINNVWDKKDTPEFQALCSIYFDIASSLQTINERIISEQEIFELIKIIIFGYLGEHPHFVKNCFRNFDIINKIDSSVKRLFQCRLRFVK